MDADTKLADASGYEPPTVAAVPLEEGTVFTAAGASNSYQPPAPPQTG